MECEGEAVRSEQRGGLKQERGRFDATRQLWVDFSCTRYSYSYIFPVINGEREISLNRRCGIGIIPRSLSALNSIPFESASAALDPRFF